METKEELRRKGLRQRSSMPEKEVKEKGRKIQEKILEITDRDDTVMTYVSYRNEVETDLLIEKLLERNQALVVPKTSGDEMKAFRIQSMEELEENSKGIREPKDAEQISKASIDICIIPGVKFDRKGNRIGYGKGYYDRFLENFQGQKIGLTYQKLMEEKIPTDEWDIQMDKIITEENVYRGF
jgi:5-formyltetrahydrofolate cyclo-ligase